MPVLCRLLKQNEVNHVVFAQREHAMAQGLTFGNLIHTDRLRVLWRTEREMRLRKNKKACIAEIMSKIFEQAQKILIQGEKAAVWPIEGIVYTIYSHASGSVVLVDKNGCQSLILIRGRLVRMQPTAYGPLIAAQGIVYILGEAPFLGQCEALWYNGLRYRCNGQTIRRRYGSPVFKSGSQVLRGEDDY